MSGWFLWTISALYFMAFLGFLAEGKAAAAIMTLCYSVANVAYTFLTR
jgi:hypothetical protein